MPADSTWRLIPQMFDDAIPIKPAKGDQLVLGIEIQAECETGLPAGGEAPPAALLALGANTLLGSVCLTIVERLKPRPARHWRHRLGNETSSGPACRSSRSAR